MRSRVVSSALVVGLLLAVTAPTGAQARPEGLAPGHWAVGFTHRREAAPVRSPPAASAEIGIWYPARRSGAPPLTYRRYFLLPPGPGDTASRPAELAGFVGFLEQQGAAEPEISAWLDAPMRAVADAAPIGGRFPLVLIAQGNGQTLHDQAPLAEYLASYGYVVATAPSPTRVTGPITGEGEMGRRAEEQARDLAAVRDAVGQRTDVRSGPVGVVGHSFGARAALLFAMRTGTVAALVSLDGGIGTATGRGPLEAAPSFRAAGMRAPFLHLYERLDPFMRPDFGLLCALDSAEGWLVEVPEFHHHHFTSLGAAALAHPPLRGPLAATAGTAAAYRAMAAATLDFLDAFVAGDSAARARVAAGRPPLGAPRRLAGACPAAPAPGPR